MNEYVLGLKAYNTTLVLPTFKLPARIQNMLWGIILSISVYDYWSIGPCSVVCIFHKGITSYVLCGYEVQLNMWMLDFERKSTFK